MKQWMRYGFFATAILLTACGGSAGSGSAGGTPTPDQATRIAAAQQTAANNAHCTAVSPFYYELGDRNGAITSGQVGGSTYTATTRMSIASASKWLFGAYVAEVRNGVLNTADLRATRMLSGYVSMADTCGGVGATVGSCFHSSGNDTYTASEVDYFNYNGGHFQKWGDDNGMAGMTANGVEAAYLSALGLSTQFTGPLLAGGAYMSASEYAVFLRKILNGQLQMTNLLGSHPVCAQPSSCPTVAHGSPVTAELMHYSIGHWVEDDPVLGDGAFNSAGAFGFYPWIDSSKTYYGILARMDTSAATSKGYASALCGRAIRKAYTSGVVQ